MKSGCAGLQRYVFFFPPPRRSLSHLCRCRINIDNSQVYTYTQSCIQQPTAFHLETFSLDHVFETPELITSLYNHSMSRQTSASSSSSPSTSKSIKQTERQSSILFLRLSAAAEYFTMNSTLMNHPEPVLADIILDPFLFNILPRTLVPTVGFVVFVALVSWILGVKVVRPWLTALVGVDADGREKEKKIQ